jgi:tRNA dimethylallyltransferase
MIKNKPKILVVVGPTSSGKSDLVVRLARDFNGEIISADSRQVYKNLDIGTGKVTKHEMDGIPHHLLDVVSPKKTFNVVNFQKKAYHAIDDILKRGKIPIIAGGTGFYIQSIVDGVILPEIPKNEKLRKQLEQMDLPVLQSKLKKLDADRFEEIDIKNKVRLIRAVEIATALGKVPKTKSNPKYECLQIGIEWPKDKLDKRISDRLIARMRRGLVAEVKNLHANGLSWKRMEALGLEYRYVSRFVRNLISKEELVETLTTKIIQYAKRQMAWLKRDQRIKWFAPNKYIAIKKTVKDFYK